MEAAVFRPPNKARPQGSFDPGSLKKTPHRMLYTGDVMAITINNPEIEAIIQRRLQSGAFENVDQVLLDALAEENMWDNPTPEELAWLGQKLNRSIAQLDRGEGISPEELRQQLNDDRESWPSQRQTT